MLRRLPEIGEPAVKGPKFNTTRLAVATLASRLADLDSAAAVVLSEPARFVLL